ncbi:MAG: asparagine--tRNA ligase [Bacteroidetes bacterium]|nr:asparagine--tRNA ligase [Bacteroidota bacterium]MDA0950426.1 asparagine--tRNA ligase [Bacteroidota bacterium]
MYKPETIKQLLERNPLNDSVTVMGWVRTFRSNRFIALNDGSTLTTLQCVVDFETLEYGLLSQIHTGTALKLTGLFVESQGKGQSVEIQVTNLEILGTADPDHFPIQPKKHSLEFLREKAHLRIRTNTFAAIMRVRSALAFAVHQYFNSNGFFYMNTPIITGSDAEGAGEMFKLSNTDFFGKETHLTVSGQLEAETYAMGLGKVYTFGPTFRAENSNTSRHLAEFWMIEPEMAFYDLEDTMELAEDFIKNTIGYVLEHCKEDLSFLEQRLTDEDKTKPENERSPMLLLEKLKFVVDKPFIRLSYTEAFEILKYSKENQKKKFKYPISEWGSDLQSEHERYLVEKHFNAPVVLFDYPAKIKAFYMRLNEDQQTVRAMDVLFPGIGEIVGGSQREERLDVLELKINQMGIDAQELWWYLELRKFGTAVHSGFGLGFERLIMFATGMGNIRDVIPYPRTPQNAEF